MQCLRGPNQSHTIQPLPSPDEAATSIWPAAFGKSVPLSRATPRRAPDGSGGATMLPPQSGRPPPLRRSAPRTVVESRAEQLHAANGVHSSRELRWPLSYITRAKSVLYRDTAKVIQQGMLYQLIMLCTVIHWLCVTTCVQ